MSWYGYDANGYVGDIASVGGWADFSTFLTKLGGEAASFVKDGYTDNPKGLAKQLDGAKATAGSDESIRANLITLANKADEVLILHDGVDDGSGDESKSAVHLDLTKKGVKGMGVSVNSAGRSHANSLVDAGKVDRDSSWSFSGDDGNKLLGANGDDWENYSQWFLGVDSGEDEKTKAHYKYPFGKDGKVFRSGLIAAKQRAAQQGASDIEAAANSLLEKIDKGNGKATVVSLKAGCAPDKPDMPDGMPMKPMKAATDGDGDNDTTNPDNDADDTKRKKRKARKDSSDDGEESDNPDCDCSDPDDRADPECDCQDDPNYRDVGDLITRAWSRLEIKSIDDDPDGTMKIEGLASTPETDRMGDIVEPMGAKFKLPMPFLWQHDSAKPIGLVDFAQPHSKGIPFRATIAKRGVASYIDEARNLIRAGLVRGTSIGFRDIKSEPVNPPSDDNPAATMYGMLGLPMPGPKRFKEWEWMELSAVTIPANASATIQTIKSIDQKLLARSGASAKTSQGKSVAPPAVKTLPKEVHLPGVAGQSVAVNPPPISTKGKTMQTIQEQIAAYEQKRAANLGSMNELMAVSAKESRTLTDEEATTYDELENENNVIDKHLLRLRRHQKTLEQGAQAVNVAAAGGGSGSNDTDPQQAHLHGQATPPQPGRGTQTITPFRSNSNLPKGMAFVRYAMLLARAKGNVMLAREYAKDPYIKGSTPEVEKAFEATYQRSAVAAGTTTDSTWAGPLVQLQPMASEFVEFLYPMTIIGRIPNFRRVPFNVKMPRQTSMSSSKWVGQGAPKPVSKIDFETISLGFAKVSTIIVMTEDLVRFSNPSSEAIARTDMAESISKFLDQQFADPTVTAVSNVSPASVTNGAFSHNMSSADIAGVTSDVNALIGEFTTHNVDPTGSYWLMNPRTAQAIGTLRTSLGVFAFPTINMSGGTFFGLPVLTSNNIALSNDTAQHAYAVLVKPSEIFMADDGAINVDLSNEASLEMDDSPSGGATSLVSLWQNNLVGIRSEQYINWLPRRAHAVAVWSSLTL